MKLWSLEWALFCGPGTDLSGFVALVFITLNPWSLEVGMS